MYLDDDNNGEMGVLAVLLSVLFVVAVGGGAIYATGMIG
jgi:hypothetical protein